MRCFDIMIPSVVRVLSFRIVPISSIKGSHVNLVVIPAVAIVLRDSFVPLGGDKHGLDLLPFRRSCVKNA